MGHYLSRLEHDCMSSGHPFEGTPQFEQQYGNQFGPPIGRRGNGLGDVWGADGGIDEEYAGRRPRMNYSRSIDEEFEDAGLPGFADILPYLGELTMKQAFVIRLRFGLDDYQPYTLEEVAVLMGISHQAVRGLEKRAIARLQVVVSSED